MNHQPNHRDRQLIIDLEEIQKGLSGEGVQVSKIIDHPHIEQYAFQERGTNLAFANVICSLNQVTVALHDAGKGYIFFTPTEHPLAAMVKGAPIAPEVWEENMLSHSNNGPVQEGYYWDWINYSVALTELREKWHANRNKFADQITRNALKSAILQADKILGVVASLPDVISLTNAWEDKWHPLPEDVPVDDYLLWDKDYLRALAMIYQLASTRATSPQE
ncbi:MULTISPECIES: hypothetical protein [Pantoea]|uniref:Uncharacterized protein n=1 Tax=Pantoea brenneri TaxID=472694 RepID=A0ABU9MUQ8_9GAMM|nr:hypothetical protein [Pantoea sp. 3.5.1]KKD30155.1 hypothetical protein EP46_22195 [Pantoea sp. 3.5.1]